MTKRDLEQHTVKLRRLKHRERRRYLQELIGPLTSDAKELDMRALLMTRLSAEGIWPPRGVEVEQ